jgi:hypothetical protein
VTTLATKRPRRLYLALLAATVAAGLASRRFGSVLPDVVARYAGDTLWATMMFWLLSLVRPGATPLRLALGALSISYAVELSQLYHAPWIDSIRATVVGGLVLGRGFLWSDLVCYAAGVAIAAAVDARFTKPGS